jgi:hypothetical protein
MEIITNSRIKRVKVVQVITEEAFHGCPCFLYRVVIRRINRVGKITTIPFFSPIHAVAFPDGIVRCP